MMLLALGINHKTAPLAIRERVVFAPGILYQKALNSLLKQPMVNGGVLLSTCNRTELYLSVKKEDNLKEKLVTWICNYHHLNTKDVYDNFYWYQDAEAVSHLMRVASGLDSLIIGEPQILGQIKKAFAYSQREHSLSVELNRMFQKSFFAAKRVRTETNIGTSAVSLPFIICKLACKIFESLTMVKVLLIGAGEMVELAARYFRQHKVSKLIIANRTYERAKKLGIKFGAEIIHLHEIDARLSEADIIISSTASPIPIINNDMVERALKKRRNQPILLVDIAVPRDVKPEVGKLPNTYLYSIDDLNDILKNNIAQRQESTVQAETIIQKESSNFMSWLRAQDMINVIRDYRLQSEKIRDELQNQALIAIQQGIDPEIVIRKLAYKLTNRLIRTPTKSLQEAVYAGDGEKLHVLRYSLGLE